MLDKPKDVVLKTDGEYYESFVKNTNGGTKRVMMGIFKVMGKDTNLFCSRGSDKEKIIELAEVAEQTYNNAISTLRKLDLIVPTGSPIPNEYQVNCLLAYKGRFDKVWNTGMEIEKRITGMEHEKMIGSVESKEAPMTDDDYKKLGMMTKHGKVM